MSNATFAAHVPAIVRTWCEEELQFSLESVDAFNDATYSEHTVQATGEKFLLMHTGKGTLVFDSYEGPSMGFGLWKKWRREEGLPV